MNLLILGHLMGASLCCRNSRTCPDDTCPDVPRRTCAGAAQRITNGDGGHFGRRWRLWLARVPRFYAGCSAMEKLDGKIHLQ